MDKKKPLKSPTKRTNGSKPIPASASLGGLNSKTQRDYHIFFLCAIIAVVSFIRYRFITIPFERDEGEYGYIGSLFLHGVAPFKDAYSMKLPGTSFMYAVLMVIFGHTGTGVHLGMVFINAGTMYFLFAAFKKLFNPFIGLATASIYGFMAISLPFEGYAAHATHFICFYSSISLLFLADFIKSGKMLKIFLFGLMLGMAFIMKQQAVFFILFGTAFLFAYLKVEKKKPFAEIIKDFLIFGLGIVIPFALVVLIIVFAGQFHVFWLWTMEYASQYEAIGKSADAVTLFFKSTFLPAWDNFYYLWISSLAGILVLFWSPHTRLQKSFVLIYCIASVCALSSGLYFRQHYYIVLLPAIGLLSGILVEFVIKQLGERLNISSPSTIALLALSAIIIFSLYDNRKYYFKYTPQNFSYADNPFNEAPEIAKYIRENTTDTDKIAILGSEPEIYFYANRIAATGFLYTYPLVERQSYNEVMQEQMIREIEKNKPAYLVLCNIYLSWLIQPGTPNTIFEWAKNYTQKNYTASGFIDFWGNDGWKIYWNDAIKNRTAQPQSYIVIFKRNQDNKK